MTGLQPRYSKEEFARRGGEIYERDIRPIVEKGNEGKYVVIDIESGAYEMDADEIAAPAAASDTETVQVAPTKWMRMKSPLPTAFWPISQMRKSG